MSFQKIPPWCDGPGVKPYLVFGYDCFLDFLNSVAMHTGFNLSKYRIYPDRPEQTV